MTIIELLEKTLGTIEESGRVTVGDIENLEFAYQCLKDNGGNAKETINY